MRVIILKDIEKIMKKLILRSGLRTMSRLMKEFGLYGLNGIQVKSLIHHQKHTLQLMKVK